MTLLNRMPVNVMAGLQAAQKSLDADVERLRADITGIEEEKAAKTAEIRAKMAKDLADNEALYAVALTNTRDELKRAQSEIANLARAMSALGATPSPEVKKTIRPEDEVTSEMIYDQVINVLYQQQDGLTSSQIADMLDQRRYLDPAKNRHSLMANIIGNMVKNGFVDRRNQVYVLADKQEAEQRVKLRKHIIRILTENGKPMSAADVQKTLIQSGLPETNDRRRVRGMLLGMSRGNYIQRTSRDNAPETFQIAA